jgi:hypothetical protein
MPPAVYHADAATKGLSLGLALGQYWILRAVRPWITGNRVGTIRKCFEGFVTDNMEKRGKRLAQGKGSDTEFKDLYAILK